MALLYSITHVQTKAAPFSWTLEEIDDSGFLDTGALIVWTLSKGVEPDAAITADIETLFAWTKAQLAKAGEALFCTIIGDLLHQAKHVTPQDVLAQMEKPNFNLYEYCFPTANEDNMPSGKEMLFFQFLLHQVFPDRFALPLLAEVSVYGFDIHPDAGEFKVSDESMAVRVLMDQQANHPLNALFPEAGESYDGMLDIVFRIQFLGGPNDIYAIWLPVHLTGALSENESWESTAYPFS